MSTEHAPVRVLYFAGTGRSGTTILSNILGQVSGCFAAGEVRFVWQRGLVENHRCGCGEPFNRCPVWTAVLGEAFKTHQMPDPGLLAARLSNRLRVRRAPLMVLRRLCGRPALKPHPDDADILRLYQALSDHRGVETVIDSSKLPLYGMLLSCLPGIETYVVHVVRDPRATAFSWQRNKATQDTESGATMDRLETWRSALLWILWNSLAEAWWPRTSTRCLLVRYEDLVRDPGTTVERVLQMIGCQLPPSLISGHSIALSPTHSVAGNPNRHETGVVELRVDDEWQREMPPLRRALVTAITAPGLRRFGYSVRTRTGRRPAG